MELPARFTPSRRLGLIVHSAALLLLGSGGGFSLWFSLQQQVRLSFAIWLLLSLALLAPVPFLLYRTYGLAQASYSIDRDGLRIRWGLRSEDIPLPDIEWVRPADEMGLRLPLPFLKWPGAVLGSKFSADLGPIEYIASEHSRILLIATPQKIYAISPDEPRGFLRAFQTAIEMGSLSPLDSYSTRPAAFLQNVWKDNFARSFILASLVLTIGLFISASLLISSRTSLFMGFDINGLPLEAGPSEHVFLLPVLGAFAFILSLFAGMFYYRRTEGRFIAYLIWASGLITPTLLLIAIYLMI